MPAVQETLLGKVAYRCDTRSPNHIFTNGFWNKKSNLELVWPDLAGKLDFDPMGVDQPQYAFQGMSVSEQNAADPSDFDLVSGNRLADGLVRYVLQHKVAATKKITVTLPIPGEEVRAHLYQDYANNQPFYRADRGDINPVTAVCFSLSPAVTPYFPIRSTPDNGERVWLYAVFLNTAVHTFEMATRDGKPLSFAREVATEHVPPELVICATRCWRKGRQYPAGMLFNLDVQTQWNKKCRGEVRSGCRTEIDAALTPMQGYMTLCPTAGQAAVQGARKPYFALDDTFWRNTAFPD